MDVWHDGKYWRIGFVSRIQRKWPRRLALIASLPIMLLWSVAVWTIKTVFVVVAAPFVFAYDAWPGEMFRTFALRWNVPLPPLNTRASTGEDSP